MNRPNYNSFKDKTFLIPGGDVGVARLVHRFGGRWTRDLDGDFDAVIFTGGEDVSPFLYGEKTLPFTHCNIKRDLREVHIFKNLPLEMPKIGICRGAQLMNVLCGGRMWQHVNNHAAAHEMRFMGDQTIRVSSTHHQMMIPTSEALVLGWGKQASVKERADEVMNLHENDWEDPEVVFYESKNSLCFQPHPEYASYDDCTSVFIELVRALFDPAKKEDDDKPF